MDSSRWYARRWSSVLITAVLVLATGLAVAPPAAAQLYGPIPANAASDPTNDFTDQDSIWAYVRSDIAGGFICIVPESATAESGSCAGAPGGKNRLVGIGTLYTLITGHGLPAGNYRLLVENSVEEPTEVSEVFTVTTCPDCPVDPDAATVAAWKAAASAMSGPTGNMTMMCKLTDVLEKVAGKAVKARGIVALPSSDDVSALTADTLSFVMTFASGGFVMYNPLTVNIRKGLDIQKALSCAAQQMYADQAADPPDPNFGTVAQPVYRDVAALGPTELDTLSTSQDRQRALGVAMLHGYERYQGARDAGNPDAEVQQLRAAGGLAGQQADELQQSAAALRSWADVAAADDELSGVLLTPAERDEIAAAHARVRTDGFTGAELDQLHTLGYSDAEIAIIRAQFTSDIDAIPVDTTYPDALRQAADGMDAQVQAYRDFGLELLVVAGRIAEANANHAPTADDLSVDATSGLATTVTLSGADTDGDPITFDIVQQPGHGTLGGSGASRTYTSAAGFTGTDTFTYTASDASESSAPATVTITVAPRSNTAPTAYDASVTTGQGVPVAVQLGAADPEGDPLTYDVDPPHDGQLSGTAPDLTYTPAPGFVGTDAVRFRVSDGELSSGDGVVSINVTPHISLQDDVLRADPSGVVDVLTNDGSTTPLTVVSASAADHGSVTCRPLGGCTYRGSAGYTGTDTFSYVARDQAGRTATAHVQVEVVEAPAGTSGPVALDDRTATTAGKAVDVVVTTNDDGAGTLVVSEATDPPHGSVSCSAAGTCHYIPDPGFSGYDGFTYALTDDNATTRASVDIVVAPAGAGFDIGISGRPVGPGDQITQGEPARWGVSVTPTQALSQDEVAALARPSGSARPSGPHAVVAGSVDRSPGWSADLGAPNVSFGALAPAVLGNRITRPVPRPQPPISQGTGGDGHVPILVGTKVFAFFHHSLPTSVTCMDRATGKLCPGYPRTVWQMGTTDINGPGAVVDGKIYVHLISTGYGGSTRGVSLYCWDTRTDSTCGLEVLGRVPAAQSDAASFPVLVQGKIYVAAQDGRMYCYDPSADQPCATPSTPTGLAANASSQMDVVTHAGRIYASDGIGAVACLVVPSMAPCGGWASPKELGGWNLLTQHDAAGVPTGVCAVQGAAGQCVTDAGQLSTMADVPVNDGYYGNTEEGETGRRTFIASLSHGGLGCWDWSTSAPCAGDNFDAAGWVTLDSSDAGLPSAYGTTWDGSCLVALGDPGQVFTMDVEGNSPCTSLATGSSSLSMDLRDQRCDASVGRAAWREVSLLETNPSGTELTSVRVRVLDAATGAELLTGDLIGGTGRLSLAGIDPLTHPSLRVEAIAVARAGDTAWSDGVAPRIALSWTADPMQVCFTTATTVDCAQPPVAAVLVRASLTGSSREVEAAVPVKRSPGCTGPNPHSHAHPHAGRPGPRRRRAAQRPGGIDRDEPGRPGHR